MKNKYLIIAIVFVCLLGWLTTSEKDKKENINEVTNIDNEKPNKVDLIKELPKLEKKSIDVGKFKIHQDGYSIGKNTEMHELGNQLNNPDIGIIEITWIWDYSPPNPDIPMKLIYNKTDEVLKVVYTSNNIIEEYKNIKPSCLSNFIKDGNKSFLSITSYCEESSYEFNDSEKKIRAVGPRPEQSEWSGSVDIVEKYIKSTANDETSIKFLEWSEVSPFGDFWVVKCKYKGTNGLGAMVTETKWFYIQNDKVIKTKDHFD